MWIVSCWIIWCKYRERRIRLFTRESAVSGSGGLNINFVNLVSWIRVNGVSWEVLSWNVDEGLKSQSLSVRKSRSADWRSDILSSKPNNKQCLLILNNNFKIVHLFRFAMVTRVTLLWSVNIVDQTFLRSSPALVDHCGSGKIFYFLLQNNFAGMWKETTLHFSMCVLRLINFSISDLFLMEQLSTMDSELSTPSFQTL